MPIEVSGGVRLENVRAYAEARPDFIAIGALTHSAPAVDISLEVEPRLKAADRSCAASLEARGSAVAGAALAPGGGGLHQRLAEGAARARAPRPGPPSAPTAQTAGRGRGGHAWVSPPGNLYLSVVRAGSRAAVR